MVVVRQAANALQILEYFARRLKPATAADIAEDLGWPRSSTFKMLGTLAEMGFLYEPQPRGGYYPSPRWLDLAERVTRADPLPDALRRLVRDLARATGETVLIAAPAGEQAMFLEVEESRQPVRYFASPGSLVPIHASSAGRALLAQMPAREREQLYRRIRFEGFSPTTPLTPVMVEAELEAARARGFHQSNAEYIPDLAGVALALPFGHRRLSIVVVGPVSRCLERRPAIAGVMAQHLDKLKQEGA